jgi:hypothetical protein
MIVLVDVPAVTVKVTGPFRRAALLTLCCNLLISTPPVNVQQAGNLSAVRLGQEYAVTITSPPHGQTQYVGGTEPDSNPP